MTYSIYDEQQKKIRNDFSCFDSREELKECFESHMEDVLMLGTEIEREELGGIEELWRFFEYKIIETPTGFIDVAEEKV